jgi:hypothetical protein
LKFYARTTFEELTQEKRMEKALREIHELSGLRRVETFEKETEKVLGLIEDKAREVLNDEPNNPGTDDHADIKA